jgi:4-alpha-glucanotransferase
MNKKMGYVSGKLEKFRNSGKGDAEDLAAAEKDLLRGQCNCAYWHGVFGGLYLFHLRRALYHHAIRSEARMDKVIHGKNPFCSADVVDFDADGLDEIVLENRKISLYLDPAEGGTIKEFDSKEICQNMLNSLARRKEAYHKDIIKKIEQPAEEDGGVKTIHDGIQTVDKGMKDHLTYDWYDRYSLIDHFIGEDVSQKAFARCEYDERGDFVKGVYEMENELSPEKIKVALSRLGLVGGSPVMVEKEIIFPRKDARFLVNYVIENKGDKKINFIFGPEFNLTMPDADSERYSLVTNGSKKGSKLGETVSSDGIDLVEVVDEDKRLSFSMKLSEKVRFWHFPVRTVSQSEKSYELNYQSSVLFPHFKCELDAGQKRSIELEVRLLVKR